MPEKKKDHPKEKAGMHPRNKHRERYDFKLLIGECSDLEPYVAVNKYGDESIDFFNPEAVKMLNKALLKTYYGIASWDIPQNYLVPPVPGRAEYIHHVADLLSNSTKTKGHHSGKKITCLDIGVGANCIFPIIGVREYGWSFIGTDTDLTAIKSARKIVDANPSLKGMVDLRFQKNSLDIFRGTIEEGEFIDITICNPPFHTSAEEAQTGTQRKLSNLKHSKHTNTVLNFGGRSNELWCKGGEAKFIKDMIFQSRQVAASCNWFTTLVSKQSNLKAIYEHLKQVNAVDVKTIPMAHGNKMSRIVAWTFKSAK